jgi:acetylornithine deacetylase/succinyl-diaminopimelate desuccinylase-like protein
MMCAAIALTRSRVPLNGCLRLTAVMGDEEGHIGMRHLLDGGMRADAFISAQWSTAKQIALGYRGLCWVEVTTSGRTAHGSRPASGINAVEQMMDIVLPRLRSLELHAGTSVPIVSPGPSVNLACLEGGSAPNIVPDLCRAILDYRLVSGQRSTDIIEAIDGVLNDLRCTHATLSVERRILLQAEPLFTDPTSSLVRRLAEHVHQVTAVAPQYFGKTGTSDANLVHERLGIPVVAYGPGNDSGHGPDEFVSVDDLVTVTKVYALLAADFLSDRATPGNVR